MIKLAEPWRKEGQIGFRVLGLESHGGLTHWVHVRTDVQSVEELNTVIEANLNHYRRVRVIPNVFIGGEYYHPLPTMNISKEDWYLLEY